MKRRIRAASPRETLASRVPPPKKFHLRARICHPPRMPDRANAPHDALFRKFLSHPETARDFLDIHLPPSLRAL